MEGATNKDLVETVLRMRLTEELNPKEAALEMLAEKAEVSQGEGSVGCIIDYPASGDIYVGGGTQCQALLTARDRLVPVIMDYRKWRKTVDAKLDEIKKTDKKPAPDASPACNLNDRLYYSADSCKAAMAFVDERMLDTFIEQAKKVVETKLWLKVEAARTMLHVPDEELQNFVKLKIAVRISAVSTGLTLDEFESAAQWIMEKDGVGEKQRLEFVNYAKALVPYLNDFMEIGLLIQHDKESDLDGYMGRLAKAMKKASAMAGMAELHPVLQMHRIYKQYKILRSKTSKGDTL